MPDKSIQHLQTAAQAIFDKKGINILVLDVKETSELTDFVLIAEGSVDRHVSAMARDLIDSLKKDGERPLYVEGLESGDWVVIDYLNYMIHLFMPGLRDKYQLEELFRDGEIVDLKIDSNSA